jgi:hypothetical protein
MLNGQLREVLTELKPNHGNKRVMINFGGDRRGVGKVSYVTGTDPMNTVIEAGNEGWTVNGLLDALAEQDAMGEVELFIVPGDDFAYYQVGMVLVFDDMVWLTAGELISGGG